MVTKVGRGRNGRLICSDCALEQVQLEVRIRPASRRSQLLTIGLIGLFGLTAAGLMTLNDHHNPSLVNETELDLNGAREGRDQSMRWNSVLPRPSSLGR
ncbi:MAG: hypothetical protein FJ077_10035 [Cyanobacteria bacterium K_DeepCast_35m_m2_023]|nr:hypothetical protein [Cyanobacteria bacterium K_DeepCast_35m_m2_023]